MYCYEGTGKRHYVWCQLGHNVTSVCVIEQQCQNSQWRGSKVIGIRI